MFKTRILLTLAGSTILAMSSPSAAQTTPAFRVPMGAAPTSSTVEPTYAWLEQLGNCSTTCGTGTRSTSYQCQNVADYDYSGGGYGLPEADSACTASVGPKPASTSASCTVYSGCGYDWVKPPVTQTPIPLDSNPVGRVGCGYVKTVFSPYCQRTGGGANVVMANGDHRFCSGDRPDYDTVAAGDPDALGYDRNVTQTGACNTSDHEWRPSDTTTGWGSWSSLCDTSATRTRAVTCYRKFDGTAQPDTSCSSATRPASSETVPQYSSCSYSYSYGTYGTWSSGCDTNATRTRTESCIRSNNGGQAVPISECTSRGVGGRQATSETAPQYDSCSYSFQPTAWGGWSSGCDANATRTRSAPCVRSNNGGQTVADTECTNRGQTKPATTETAPQYGSCSYSFTTGAWGSYNSSCSNSATRTRSVTCMRNNNGGTAVADSECTSRGVARPTSSEATGQYGGCSYSAVNPGAWSGWASGCSNSTTRTRQYQCLRNNDGGQIVADGECTGRGVSLTETQSGANYASCTYTWQAGGWSGWNSGCSANAVRTRSVWCRRDMDGATVADSSCTGTRPPSSETSAQYGSCGYSRGAETSVSGWSSGCSSSATRTHYYNCNRSDGAVVAASECTSRGIAITSTETGANYASCTYSLQDAGVGACQSNNTAPHYWRCIRNQTGEQVDSAAYCGRSNPTYDSCSYYSYELQDAGLGACQTNNQAPHYWRCIRRPDGVEVDSATYCGRANPTYESCSYNWDYNFVAGAWSDWSSHCSSNARRTRAVWCYRSDGTMMDPNHQPCYDKGRVYPGWEQYAAVYDGCSYSIEDAGLGACQSNNQRPHYWRCRRADGAEVDSATYCGRNNPTYESCSYYSYSASASNWTACSTSGTQTRTVSCTRYPDGAQVDSATYCGRQPTESQSCTPPVQQYGAYCAGATSGGGVNWGNNYYPGFNARKTQCFNAGGTCYQMTQTIGVYSTNRQGISDYCAYGPNTYTIGNAGDPGDPGQVVDEYDTNYAELKPR